GRLEVAGGRLAVGGGAASHPAVGGEQAPSALPPQGGEGGVGGGIPEGLRRRRPAGGGRPREGRGRQLLGGGSTGHLDHREAGRRLPVEERVEAAVDDLVRPAPAAARSRPGEV